MKTSFISILALATSLMGVMSAPTAEVSIEKRASDPISLVINLLATVQVYTAQINTTVATLTPTSSPAEKKVASDAIQKCMKSITAAVVKTTKQVPTKPIAARQVTSPTSLANIILTLLLDLSGTLNNVIAGLGLTAALAFAQPLVLALSNLLLSLAVVVDNLLVVVRQLVGALLIGLSAALAGLIL
ncbi:MAG: hypothetical protein Q9187_009357 [Circinaria calcarea]